MKYQFTHFDSGQFAEYMTFMRRYRTDDAPTPGDLRQKWRIFDNPYGGSLMFAHTDQEVVAMLTLTGRRLATAGRAVVSFELGDGWTAAEHRGQGLFFRLGSYARELAFSQPQAELIFGTPNPQAAPNWRKHRYRFTQDDGRALVIVPSALNLAGRSLRRSGRDDVESVYPQSRWRIGGGVITEIHFSDYAARTQDFPRMNSTSNRYLCWRFAESTDRYRYFFAPGRAGDFYCAVRVIRLGRFPFLIVSEHFHDGSIEHAAHAASSLALARRVCSDFYRNQAGIVLNHPVNGVGRPTLRRYLRMVSGRYLEHRAQPICYLFRDAPTATQQALMEGLRRVFQLSDCDMG